MLNNAATSSTIAHRLESYAAFGCVLLADIPFGRACSTANGFDVRIEQGPVPLEAPADLARTGPFAARSKHRAWHRIPGVFRAYAASPHQINWYPEKALPSEAIVEFLLDTLAPETLSRRGYLLRFGLALCNDERALLVLGLEARLATKTWLELASTRIRYLSEGLCAIRLGEEGICELLPGIPRIRSWENDTDTPRAAAAWRIRDGVAVYAIHDVEHFSKTPKPLTHILFVDSSPAVEDYELAQVRGKERMRLMGFGRIPQTDDIDPGARARAFKEWTRLSESVQFLRLAVHDGADEAERITTCIHSVLK